MRYNETIPLFTTFRNSAITSCMWQSTAYKNLDSALQAGMAALLSENERVVMSCAVRRALRTVPPLVLTKTLRSLVRDIETEHPAVLQRKILRTRRLLAFYVASTFSEYDQTGKHQHAQHSPPLRRTIQ